MRIPLDKWFALIEKLRSQRIPVPRNIIVPSSLIVDPITGTVYVYIPPSSKSLEINEIMPITCDENLVRQLVRENFEAIVDELAALCQRRIIRPVRPRRVRSISPG